MNINVFDLTINGTRACAQKTLYDTIRVSDNKGYYNIQVFIGSPYSLTRKQFTEEEDGPCLSDADSVEYVRSFIETKIDNVTPLLVGFNRIRLTVLDEDFNEIIKEYSRNDKID